ncbi:MAG: substrate-binding domain-containing protein [Bacillota bacterium]
MRLPVSLVVLSVLVIAWGCGNRQAAQKPYAPPLKIAVSLADMERDGNKIIKNVMESRKKKDKVEITWLDAKNDQAEQEKQLEKLGQQKVKAVVFQPVSPVTGPGLMRRLVEKNIKVVALETLPVDAPVEAYVASDHTLAGQLLARFAIRSARKSAGLPVSPDSADYGGGRTQVGGQEAGGQQGQSGAGGGRQEGGGGQSQAVVPPEAQLGGKLPIGVVLLSGDPGDTAAREIAAAARAEMQGSSEVRLVAEEAVPQNDPSLVPRILQRVMVERGNNVQAVLAVDSSLAMAAVEVLKSAGINNSVLTAGVGADEKSSMALAKGEHDAEVDTRPDLLGQYALDAAIALAKDGRWQYDGQSASGSYSVPSRITPVRLIQSNNVYLLEQRWGGLKGKKEGGQGGRQGGGSEGGSGSGGGSGQEGSGQGGGQGSGGQGQGGQGKKTMLRITTQDGKTMEVQIDGEIKKIESMGGGGQGGQKGGQQGQSGGGGGQQQGQ